MSDGPPDPYSNSMSSGATGTSEPWYQKRAAQIAGVGLLGLILGSCAGGEDNADELTALRAEQESTVEQLEDAEARADSAEQEADRLREQVADLRTRATAEPEPEPVTTTPAPTPPDPGPTTEAPAPATTEPEPEPESADVTYANCSEVRAAGADPIRRGDPGYSSKLDRDDDGVACE